MANGLREFSDQVAALVEAAAASVVSVSARPGKPASGTVWEPGVVVTASHAIIDEETITVRGATGEHPATLVGRDNGTDLAVLRVEGLDAAPLKRGEALRTGDIVVALGRPAHPRASVGHVVSTSASQRGWRGGLSGMILSDAHLYEGFSGGPLLDADGNLVGFNSWYYGRGSTRSLTMEAVAPVVASLATHGRVKKPYLGIGSQPVSLDPEAAAAAGQERGLMVIGVEPASPAAEAGMLQGDTLVGIDERSVTGMRDLFGALRAVEVGSTHSVRVVRAGTIHDLNVTVGERADDAQG